MTVGVRNEPQHDAFARCGAVGVRYLSFAELTVHINGHFHSPIDRQYAPLNGLPT
jgi:hypothetical protein